MSGYIPSVLSEDRTQPEYEDGARYCLQRQIYSLWQRPFGDLLLAYKSTLEVVFFRLNKADVEEVMKYKALD